MSSSSSHKTNSPSSNNVTRTAPTTGTAGVDLNLNLQQWTFIVRALSIAGGYAAQEGDTAGMFEFNSLSNYIGQRLGFTGQMNAKTAVPAAARAAGAS